MSKPQRKPGGGTFRKPKGQSQVQPIRLDDEWRRWIAENLIIGADPSAIGSHLVQRGASPALAEAEVRLALESPYLRGADLLKARLAKRDWVLGNFARLAAIGGVTEVPRIRAIDPDRFFADFYAAHRPVMLEGVIDHWPAMRLWSLDHIAAKLGGALVQVQTKRESDPDYERLSETHRELMRADAFIARLRAGPSNDIYLTANNADRNQAAFAPLWEEVGPLPGILDDARSDGTFLWVGPQGTVTPFHHDLTNNLLVQIRGRKRVWLVPSWETSRMRNHMHCYSQLDGPAAIAALPEADRPAMIECVIGEGDALFIPVGWWHHVEGLDVTIGLSFTRFARGNDFYSSYQSYGAV